MRVAVNPMSAVVVVMTMTMPVVLVVVVEVTGLAILDRRGRSGKPPQDVAVRPAVGVVVHVRAVPMAERAREGHSVKIAGPARWPQLPNQRARRLEPKCFFSLSRAPDGAWKTPVGFGSAKKSTSTRPTRPAPNST